MLAYIVFCRENGWDPFNYFEYFCCAAPTEEQPYLVPPTSRKSLPVSDVVAYIAQRFSFNIKCFNICWRKFDFCFSSLLYYRHATFLITCTFSNFCFGKLMCFYFCEHLILFAFCSVSSINTGSLYFIITWIDIYIMKCFYTNFFFLFSNQKPSFFN